MTDEHTIEPRLGSDWDNTPGVMIGDVLAECAYCGRLISGGENGWEHVTDAERVLLGDPR